MEIDHELWYSDTDSRPAINKRNESLSPRSPKDKIPMIERPEAAHRIDQKMDSNDGMCDRAIVDSVDPVPDPT